ELSLIQRSDICLFTVRFADESQKLIITMDKNGGSCVVPLKGNLSQVISESQMNHA
ncbi:unnamed protein product, partial [Larinioides sclopetarius]